MGGCLSTQEGCVPIRPRLRRRRGMMKSRVFGYHKVSKIADEDSEDSEDLDLDTPFAASANEAWLEPNPLYESESSTSSDDEYHSVPDMLLDEQEDSNEEKNSNVHSYFSISSIMIRKKPLAGTQFPLCPKGKEMLDSWSPIEPSNFRVRGMNYLRGRKKEYASSKAAYHPFGVDAYLSHRKINHIARFVELPAMSSASMIPAILVVNVQIPLYTPSIFQNENDGQGMNVVMYFQLSQKFEKELPFSFQESIKRFIDNEIKKVKGFPIDTTSPFRERLKILGRVANVDDLQLTSTQRKLVNAYNEKPILSRPQHEFYLGENYFEIDLDMHRFTYISRKGFDTFQDKLKICILDLGLTIQGNKTDELPENVLCCMRINGIDHTNYRHLETGE